MTRHAMLAVLTALALSCSSNPAGGSVEAGGLDARGDVAGGEVSLDASTQPESPASEVGAGDACIPDCADKECGSDGCGGECGSCLPGHVCTVEAVCLCMPDCKDKDCGDDGCGGTCGTCAPGNLVCGAEGKCIACDPVQNLFCPQGSYCTYGAGNTGPLCELAGTQKYGEPCGGTDLCAEGICIKFPETEASATCHRMCLTQGDCDEGTVCMEPAEAVYKVCAAGEPPDKTCNLLLQDCAEEVEGCYFDGAANGPICMTAGTMEEGAECSGVPNDCVEGLQCLSAGGAAWTCRKFCNTSKGSDPQCDPLGPFPKCTNYYAKQSAGYCTAE